MPMMHCSVDIHVPTTHLAGNHEEIDQTEETGGHAATFGGATKVSKDPQASGNHDGFGGATKVSKDPQASGNHHDGFGGAKKVGTPAEPGTRTENNAGLLDKNNEELLADFRSGDKTLAAALKGSDGPALLLRIQTALSDEGRMFSLMSNLQATDHETKKSIISNMRA